MNRYPLWKNLLILGVVIVSLLLAWPNLYPHDPAIEITAARGRALTPASTNEIRAVLDQAGIPYQEVAVQEGGRLLVRFASAADQLKGQEALEQSLSQRYNHALTQVAALPGWMRAIGLTPMNLGLDLRGGVQVVIDVDMDSALEQALERLLNDTRSLLREAKVRYRSVSLADGGLVVELADTEALTAAERLLRREFPELTLNTVQEGGRFAVRASLPPAEQKRLKELALEQNITTLRNRVNALGVAEPSITRQGERRILVQLPGAQDPTRLKGILGATATLEYRLVDTENSLADALAGRVPVGSKLYYEREGKPILLKRRVIVTGDQITNASSGFDSQSGTPAVFVNLDAQGARRMREVTTENVGKPMAVVFMENRTTTRLVDGRPVQATRKVEEVISVATIREPFGRRFQTTGLASSDEAHDTALLLRAGALAAPIQIVEERTIGPSLGQDNIDQGILSVLMGMGLVVLFMGVYYRTFGMIANLVLVVNLVMIVAVLGLLGATLTLPGIAGMVLTLGMAVDANVLIYERIREELKNGSSPRTSIAAGFERAFATIVDSNITTLIAALMLFSFGTGPVKGFAVTLSIGLISTMFTAVTCSRALINLLYGRKRMKTLPIYWEAIMRHLKLPQFDFLSQRRKAMVLSSVLIGVSLVSLATRGLNLGLDFTGGTLVEVHYQEPADLAEVRAALARGGFPNVMAQQYGTPRDILLRIPPQGEGSDQELGQRLSQALDAQARGQAEVRRVELVGAQVGKELVDQSGLAILFSLIGILIYVTFRFEWRFSVGAVIATLHDAILVLGAFSLFRLDFDLTVLAAVLTVIGYSLNDTIVVFDRVRENFRKVRKGTTVEIMNRSVNETMSRTIITAGTVFLVLLALYLLGGAALHGFSLALIIGVIVGTYSTVYVASAAAIALGVRRADLLKIPKEGSEVGARP